MKSINTPKIKKKKLKQKKYKNSKSTNIFSNVRNNLSLKKQLIIMCTFLVVIPLSIVAIFSSISTKSVLTDKIETASIESTHQMTLNMDRLFSDVKNIGTVLAADNRVYLYYPLDNNSSTQDVLEKTQVQNTLNSTRISKDIEEVFLVHPDGETLGTINNLDISALDFKKFYSDISTSLNNRESIISGYNGNYDTLFFCTQINTKSILVCALSVSDLDDIFNNELSNNGMEVSLTDKNNVIIYSSNKEKIGKSLDSNILSNIANDEGSFNANSSLYTYNTLSNSHKLINSTSNDYMFKEVDMANLLVLTITIIALILSVIISTYFSKVVQKPILGVVGLMKNIEEGDFTVKSDYTGSQEITILSNSFNIMIGNISDLIKGIENSSNIINRKVDNIRSISKDSTMASQQVSTAIEEIAISSTEQAKKSEETLLTINDLAKSINTVTDSIGIVTISSNSTKDVGEKSLQKVLELEAKTNETNKKFIEIANTIENLIGSLKNIDAFLKIINDISTKTKLLAINASIEAAHAGEYGSGFAVVANEVKNLSVQSTESTTEISKIIDDIRNKTSLVNTLITDSANIFSDQKIAVDYTSDSFKEILEVTSNITKEISTVKELVNGMGTLKENSITAISSISLKSEESSASTEEVMASTEEQTALSLQLSNLTNDLYSEVEVLKFAINKFKI